MAILARNFGLVFSSVGVYLSRLIRVTLDAVAGAEPCRRCLCSKAED